MSKAIVSKRLLVFALIAFLNWPSARAQVLAAVPPAAQEAAQETSPTADGQKPASPRRDQKESEDVKAKREALRKNALKLLDEVLQQLEGLKVPENRIRLEASTADVLWKYDEKRARTLFKLATTQLADLQREVSTPIELNEGPHEVSGMMTEVLQANVQGLQERQAVRNEVLN